MVLAVALILIAVLVLLGTTAVMTVTTDLKIASNYRENARALYNADAGAEFVIDYLRNNTVTYPTSNATRRTSKQGPVPPGPVPRLPFPRPRGSPSPPRSISTAMTWPTGASSFA
jgi:Tfp pilus assembly protein PilX